MSSRRHRDLGYQALYELDRALRRPVLEKYARLGRDGKPILCRGHRNKIIFTSKEAAESYIQEVAATGQATRPMNAYECPTSKRTPKHAHVSTDRPARRGRR